MFRVLIASVIITGIFLINPVNSLVAASINQDANSSIEITKLRGPLSQLNGSVNVFEKLHGVTRNSINVSFADAAKIVEDDFGDNKNIIITEGKLNVKRGSLVYSFIGVDQNRQTEYYTDVDPANDSILYKSCVMPISKWTDRGYFGDHDRFQRFYRGPAQEHAWNGFDLGSWFNKLTGSNGDNNGEGNPGWLLITSINNACQNKVIYRRG